MHWRHPNSDLFIQFVDSPVTVGHKYIIKPSWMATRAGTLPILSAADSACDRLAHYLRDADLQTLEQSADIVVAKRVPLVEIKRWLDGEVDYSESDRAEALMRLKRRIAVLRSKKR